MNNRHASIVGILATMATLLFLMVSTALAAVPGVMTYKGQLLDTGGQPVDGTRTIDFKLYGVESGGTAFWTETQTVTVAAGSFTVQLGANPANLIDDSMLATDTWLGLTVNGGSEMAPRQRMTSVAYSLRAKVAESVSSTDSLIPAGSIMAFAGTTAPAGWMLCDGAEISRTTYAKLFTAIGASHGSGDGSTTFRVPDYRGLFLRGMAGATAHIDEDKDSRAAMNPGGNTGNNIGSLQTDAYASHEHGITVADGPTGSGLVSLSYGGYTNRDIDMIARAAASAAGGSETRPKNAYVNWIIKY